MVEVTHVFPRNIRIKYTLNELLAILVIFISLASKSFYGVNDMKNKNKWENKDSFGKNEYLF